VEPVMPQYSLHAMLLARPVLLLALINVPLAMLLLVLLHLQRVLITSKLFY